MTAVTPGGSKQHCQEAKYLTGLWDSSNAQVSYFLLCRNRKPPTYSDPGPLPESGASQQCSKNWTHLTIKCEPWECWVVPIWQEMPLAPWVERWRLMGVPEGETLLSSTPCSMWSHPSATTPRCPVLIGVLRSDQPVPPWTTRSPTGHSHSAWS